MIENLPYIEKVIFDFSKIPEENRLEYPFNSPVFKSDFELNLHKNVTFLVGANGAGKSTLIEAIAFKLGLSSQGGTKNFNIETNDNNLLANHIKFVKGTFQPKDLYFLRAESFFNVATYMDEVDYLKSYGGKSLHEQSHGESFLKVFENKLKGNGLYILDEPESALSPENQLKTIGLIHQLSKQNSQFIIATHSPILLAYPNSKIISIEDSKFEEVSYEDTDNFNFYSNFMKNHNMLMNRMLYEVDNF